MLFPTMQPLAPILIHPLGKVTFEENKLHHDKHCHRKPLLQDREVLPLCTELTGWASRMRCLSYVGYTLQFINWKQSCF